MNEPKIKPWPSLAEQRANARRLRQEYTAKVRQFEQRYGFPSSELADRVDAGSLPQTADVCDWFQAIRLLEKLSHSDETVAIGGDV